MLRNRFQERYRKAARRSRRRIGPLSCKPVSPILTNLRGKHWPPSSKDTGPRFILLFDAKAENFLANGYLDEAGKLIARFPNDSSDAYVLQIRIVHAIYERKFDQALFWTEQATKSFQQGHLNLWNLVHRAYCQAWTGHHDEALATFGRVIQAIAPTPGATIPSGRETRCLLALAYAGLDDKKNALEQAHRAVADFANDGYLKPLTEEYLAEVQALCGDVDGAIVSLQHLLEGPNHTGPGNLRYSPFWDPLRKDPRFEELLKHPPQIRY